MGASSVHVSQKRARRSPLVPYCTSGNLIGGGSGGGGRGGGGRGRTGSATAGLTKREAVACTQYVHIDTLRRVVSHW